MRPADRFVAALQALRLPKGPVLVAVSGGADSVVLLDLLVRTRPLHGLELIVAHVDHGIHPDSHRVAEQVERLARGVGLRYEGVALGLGPSAGETRARVARYHALREIARRHGARFILTAHHRDDQRETVLMRFLAGTGPSGLVGMRPRTRDLARPLLAFSRRAILAYARARNLEWWDDPANLDTRHLRSWIRQELMPELERRVPALRRNLDRTRRQARTQQRALTQLLRQWRELALSTGRGRVSVAAEPLDQLPAALKVTVAQALVRRAGGPAGVVRIRRALAALRERQSGRRADLGEGWGLELAFGRLAVVPPARTAAGPGPVLLGGPVGATAWGEWRIQWKREAAPPRQPRVGGTAWFSESDLAIRSPRAGDRLVPLGGVGRRLAVRCFQDAKVPRNERAGWPVIATVDGVAWIPGVCRSATLCPEAGSPAIRVDARRTG